MPCAPPSSLAWLHVPMSKRARWPAHGCQLRSMTPILIRRLSPTSWTQFPAPGREQNWGGLRHAEEIRARSTTTRCDSRPDVAQALRPLARFPLLGPPLTARSVEMASDAGRAVGQVHQDAGTLIFMQVRKGSSDSPHHLGMLLWVPAVLLLGQELLIAAGEATFGTDIRHFRLAVLNFLHHH